MKKIVKTGIVPLLAVMAVLAVAVGCSSEGDPPTLRAGANLTSITIAGVSPKEAIPEGIPRAQWVAEGFDVDDMPMMVFELADNLFSGSSLNATMQAAIDAKVSGGAAVWFAHTNAGMRPESGDWVKDKTFSVRHGNIIYIQVTAENGSVQNYYRVKINRMYDDASLLGLNVYGKNAGIGRYDFFVTDYNGTFQTIPAGSLGAVNLDFWTQNVNVHIEAKKFDERSTFQFARVPTAQVATLLDPDDMDWQDPVDDVNGFISLLDHGDRLYVKVIPASGDGAKAVYYGVDITTGLRLTGITISPGNTYPSNAGGTTFNTAAATAIASHGELAPSVGMTAVATLNRTWENRVSQINFTGAPAGVTVAVAPVNAANPATATYQTVTSGATLGTALSWTRGFSAPTLGTPGSDTRADNVVYIRVSAAGFADQYYRFIVRFASNARSITNMRFNEADRAGTAAILGTGLGSITANATQAAHTTTGRGALTIPSTMVPLRITLNGAGAQLISANFMANTGNAAATGTTTNITRVAVDTSADTSTWEIATWTGRTAWSSTNNNLLISVRSEAGVLYGGFDLYTYRTVATELGDDATLSSAIHGSETVDLGSPRATWNSPTIVAGAMYLASAQIGTAQLITVARGSGAGNVGSFISYAYTIGDTQPSFPPGSDGNAILDYSFVPSPGGYLWIQVVSAGDTATNIYKIQMVQSNNDATATAISVGGVSADSTGAGGTAANVAPADRGEMTLTKADLTGAGKTVSVTLSDANANVTGYGFNLSAGGAPAFTPLTASEVAKAGNVASFPLPAPNFINAGGAIVNTDLTLRVAAENGTTLYYYRVAAHVKSDVAGTLDEIELFHDDFQHTVDKSHHLGIPQETMAALGGAGNPYEGVIHMHPGHYGSGVAEGLQLVMIREDTATANHFTLATSAAVPASPIWIELVADTADPAFISSNLAPGTVLDEGYYIWIRSVSEDGTKTLYYKVLLSKPDDNATVRIVFINEVAATDVGEGDGATANIPAGSGRGLLELSGFLAEAGKVIPSGVLIQVYPNEENAVLHGYYLGTTVPTSSQWVTGGITETQVGDHNEEGGHIIPGVDGYKFVWPTTIQDGDTLYLWMVAEDGATTHYYRIEIDVEFLGYADPQLELLVIEDVNSVYEDIEADLGSIHEGGFEHTPIQRGSVVLPVSMAVEDSVIQATPLHIDGDLITKKYLIAPAIGAVGGPANAAAADALLQASEADGSYIIPGTINDGDWLYVRSTAGDGITHFYYVIVVHVQNDDPSLDSLRVAGVAASLGTPNEAANVTFTSPGAVTITTTVNNPTQKIIAAPNDPGVTMRYAITTTGTIPAIWSALPAIGVNLPSGGIPDGRSLYIEVVSDYGITSVYRIDVKVLGASGGAAIVGTSVTFTQPGDETITLTSAHPWSGGALEVKLSETFAGGTTLRWMFDNKPIPGASAMITDGGKTLTITKADFDPGEELANMPEYGKHTVTLLVITSTGAYYSKNLIVDLK